MHSPPHAHIPDELNVEKRALTWPKGMARGGAAHNAGRHIGDGILVKRIRLCQRKAPVLLKGTADHGRSRCGRRTCQTKGVGKANAADIHANVHRVDC